MLVRKKFTRKQLLAYTENMQNSLIGWRPTPALTS
jgi:hypothetical protein